MATNPSALPENVGRITAPSASYPYGSAKDDSTGTTGDGTPFKQALLNDVYGFQQALLVEASIVPSGTADTATVSQYLDALRNRFTRKAIAETISAIWTFAVAPVLNNTIGLWGKTTGGVNRNLINLDANNEVSVGDLNQNMKLNAATVVTLGNSKAIQGRNVGNTAYKNLVFIDNTDGVHVGDATVPLVLDSNGVTYLLNHAGALVGVLQRLLPFAITFVQAPTILRGSYNITSVSNPATGQYLVNLTNAVAATLTTTVTATPRSTSAVITTYEWASTSQVRIYFFDAAGAGVNVSFSVSITDLAN
jgi:hypothetical protein